MSIIVTVKTKSNNGLPIKTLEKATKKYETPLVESVDYARRTRSGYVYYDVTLHESVTKEVEESGR